jgi:hypothetical protein
MIEGALIVDNDGHLEPGGVELNMSEEEWFTEAMESAVLASEDELSLEEALKGAKHADLSSAIEAELFQIEKLNTWELIVPLPGANIIPSHYVFCCKHDSKGRVAHHKARLVTMGFKQRFGVDYTETFAPTVRATSPCILLSFGACHNSIIIQVDAKNTYLMHVSKVVSTFI